MRKSKLESYMSILDVLIKKPSVFDNIAHQANIDRATLGKRLDFLVKNNLIKEQERGKRILYAITEIGVAVLEYLTFQGHLRRIAGKINVIAK